MMQDRVDWLSDDRQEVQVLVGPAFLIFTKELSSIGDILEPFLAVGPPLLRLGVGLVPRSQMMLPGAVFCQAWEQ
jgi:hypothetical protein